MPWPVDVPVASIVSGGVGPLDTTMVTDELIATCVAGAGF